jgi:hypothetical protein
MCIASDEQDAPFATGDAITLFLQISYAISAAFVNTSESDGDLNCVNIRSLSLEMLR